MDSANKPTDPDHSAIDSLSKSSKKHWSESPNTVKLYSVALNGWFDSKQKLNNGRIILESNLENVIFLSAIIYGDRELTIV